MIVSPPRPVAPGTPWPLADTADFGLIDVDWRLQLAARLERDLRRHVIETWFPRSIDHLDGGFLCDFDRRWRARGPQQRMLEFQARQTRTAARLGLAFPDEPVWREHALHGFRYLSEVMHDRDEGGWFWLVDRQGRPANGGTKHAHSTAYLIGAALEVYRLVGEPSALAMAGQAFEWLERCLHDDEHGGYDGWARRDGRRILSVADYEGEDLQEPLSQRPGLKDANVHADLLDTFTLLAEVGPDAAVERRVAELYDIITRHFATGHGSMHYMSYRDWAPVPAPERYGYHFQTPPRVVVAAPMIGRPTVDALEFARLSADHALARARSPRGGFVYCGPGERPDALGGTSLVGGERSWWVHTEALKGLLLLCVAHPDGQRYQAVVDALAQVIERDFLDHRFGGWYAAPPADRPLLRRLRRRRTYAKGDIWKDASHEADLYLAGVRMLRGLERHAPLAGSRTD